MTSGSLWNCHRDEIYDEASEDIPIGKNRIKNSRATISKSFKYKRKIVGSTPPDGNICRSCYNICKSLVTFGDLSI